MKKLTPLLALLLSAGLFSSSRAEQKWEPNNDRHCMLRDPDKKEDFLKDIHADLGLKDGQKIVIPAKLDESATNLLAVCRLVLWQAIANPEIKPTIAQNTAREEENRDTFNKLDLDKQLDAVVEYALVYKRIEEAIMRGEDKVAAYKTLAAKLKDKTSAGAMKPEELKAAVRNLIADVNKPRSETADAIKNDSEGFVQGGLLLNGSQDSLRTVLDELRNVTRFRGAMGWWQDKTDPQWVADPLHLRHEQVAAVFAKFDPKLKTAWDKVMVEANKELNAVNKEIANSVYAHVKKVKPEDAATVDINDQLLTVADIGTTEMAGKTAMQVFFEMLDASSASPAAGEKKDSKAEFNKKLEKELMERLLSENHKAGALTHYKDVDQWKNSNKFGYERLRKAMLETHGRIKIGDNGKEVFYRPDWKKDDLASVQIDFEKIGAMTDDAERNAAYTSAINKIADAFIPRKGGEPARPDSPEVKALALKAAFEKQIADIKDEGLRAEVAKMIQEGGPLSFLGKDIGSGNQATVEREIRRRLRDAGQSAGGSAERKELADLEAAEIEKLKTERDDKKNSAQTLTRPDVDAERARIDKEYETLIAEVQRKYNINKNAETAALSATETAFASKIQEVLKNAEGKLAKDDKTATITTKVVDFWFDETEVVTAGDEDVKKFFDTRYRILPGDKDKPMPGQDKATAQVNLETWKKDNLKKLREKIAPTPYGKLDDSAMAFFTNEFKTWYAEFAQARYDENVKKK